MASTRVVSANTVAIWTCSQSPREAERPRRTHRRGVTGRFERGIVGQPQLPRGPLVGRRNGTSVPVFRWVCCLRRRRRRVVNSSRVGRGVGLVMAIRLAPKASQGCCRCAATPMSGTTPLTKPTSSRLTHSGQQGDTAAISCCVKPAHTRRTCCSWSLRASRSAPHYVHVIGWRRFASPIVRSLPILP